MPQRPFEPKAYDTRLDRFRVREKIPLHRWATEAGIARGQLARYRAGEAEPCANALADLVRAASRILKRRVRASELFDLGENAPVSETPPHQNGSTRNFVIRKIYQTRLDCLMVTLGVSPNRLARAAKVSRQALLRFRSNQSSPVVSTIRKIVAGFRGMGYAVRASDLVNVGED